MLSDLRRALRTLGRAPVFAATAILLLAVTIGAMTAIASAARQVLFGPLPYRDADRLVVAGEREVRTGSRAGTSVAAWSEWHGRLRSLEGLAAVETDLTCRTPAGEYLPCARVTANFFDVLGVTPAAGRTFAAAGVPAGADVAMIGEACWRQRLGGRSLAGAELTLGGRRYAIVGVVPRDFRLAYARADVWLPIDPASSQGRRDRVVRLIGRLAPGATVADAAAEIDLAMRDRSARFPGTYEGWSGWVESMREFTVGPRAPIAALLGATVSIVLVVACFNLATLQLARALARVREFAIARALGASAWDVTRPAVMESLVLCVTGAAGGVLLAWGLRQAAVASVPELGDLVIDGPVLLLAAAVAIGSAVLTGAAPAWLASRVDIATLRRGLSERAGAGRFRSASVALQIAGALALVVMAVGLAGALSRITTTDPGFSAEGVLAAEIALPPRMLGDDDTRNAAVARLEQRLAAIPGVERVACASSLPFFGVAGARVTADRSDGPALSAAARLVAPGYFALLRIPIHAGREFAPTDVAGAPAAAIVSDRLARELWPHRSPIGRTVHVDGVPAMVVGIAGDLRSIGLRQVPVPEIYRPLLQQAPQSLSVAVRSAGPPLDLVPALRGAVDALAPDAAVSYVNSMEALLAEQSALVGWLSLVSMSFGGLALALAGIGLHGTVAYLAARRTREIGIRMALGATRADVIRLVLRGGRGPAATGLLAGAVLGIVGSRLLGALLLDAAPPTGATLAVALTVVAAAHALATWWPARRAARLDPSRALREE